MATKIPGEVSVVFERFARVSLTNELGMLNRNAHRQVMKSCYAFVKYTVEG